ncbi:hypothetical protein PRZ48_002686 [Zasmidium cellare]|uniref:Cytochrome P450 n=1 Tax=Zasmidium cellare TaxID=395010 RepID=A0ABR0ESW8_ZASCE|nr:hypothetical protein PRZ48_002686 [Zasmidium cellare]
MGSGHEEINLWHGGRCLPFDTTTNSRTVGHNKMIGSARSVQSQDFNRRSPISSIRILRRASENSQRKSTNQAHAFQNISHASSKLYFSGHKEDRQEYTADAKMLSSLSTSQFAMIVVVATFGLCITLNPPKHFLSVNFKPLCVLSAAGFATKDYLAAHDALPFCSTIFGFVAWGLLGVMVGEVLATVLLTLLYPTSDKPSSGQATKKSNKHTNCKDIIKAENATIDLQNSLPKEAARAEPNQRLQTAFGIDNCFITADKKRCTDFRAQVVKLIHVQDETWQEFAAAAKSIVQKEFSTEEDSINLFGLIQLVTMKMTRKVMWNMDPNVGDNDDAIRRLAHEVNQQWLRSKGDFKPGDKPDWRFDQQHDLQRALLDAHPDWKKDGNENPLNLILPGYETMWRVVLRCFVEVTSRSHTEAPQWKKVLNNFLQNPTRIHLDDNSYGFSAATLAKETLRLYPPTRRIYRAFKDKDTGYDFLVAADVEEMHQDEAIWGKSVRLFDPTRWLKVDEKDEDDIFMPFGAAPFRCPAKYFKGPCMPFGVSMIALLVGALVEAVDGKWVCEGGFPEVNTPLDTDREAYKDAVLRRA